MRITVAANRLGRALKRKGYAWEGSFRVQCSSIDDGRCIAHMLFQKWYPYKELFIAEHTVDGKIKLNLKHKDIEPGSYNYRRMVDRLNGIEGVEIRMLKSGTYLNNRLWDGSAVYLDEWDKLEKNYTPRSRKEYINIFEQDK